MRGSTNGRPSAVFKRAEAAPLQGEGPKHRPNRGHWEPEGPGRPVEVGTGLGNLWAAQVLPREAKSCVCVKALTHPLVGSSTLPQFRFLNLLQRKFIHFNYIYTAARLTKSDSGQCRTIQ